MRSTVTIGTRGSQLAKTQTGHVADMIRKEFPDLEVNTQIITTKGDVILDKPLAEIGGKGLFTLELETALRDGSIDLAIHSLKDLPTDDPDGLVIAAMPKRVTPNDALVCAKWDSIDALPEGAKVGTSSLRRKAQLLAHRPDLVVEDLRGNVDTRCRKVLEEGLYDAAILAAAGLERIEKSDVIAQLLPTDIMLPAASQGVLGIQTRADDAELIKMLDAIHHKQTWWEATAERSLLEGLGGGCQVPIGALASLDGPKPTLRACVFSLDGQRGIRTAFAANEGDLPDPIAVGRNLANEILAGDAKEIIEGLS
jgi:hydroxymethylbilane synthase